MRLTLKNWYISETHKEEGAVYYAHGTVFGHTSPRCSDGTYIHTSRIQDVVLSDEDTLGIQTRNTAYSVKLSEYGTLDAAAGNVLWEKRDDNTAEALACFNIPEEIYSKMAEFRMERFNRRCAFIDSCSSKLAQNELYLALSDTAGYYFDFGVINQAEGTVMLHAYVNVGMIQDSVLLMAGEFDIPARYFPYKANNLEFYDSLCEILCGGAKDANKATRLGYLRNTGNKPLNIKFTWGKCVTLAAGEELEIRYRETGDEGAHLTDKTNMYSAF